jgi:DNA (cytosine-5)-methyltransferase 1
MSESLKQKPFVFLGSKLKLKHKQTIPLGVSEVQVKQKLTLRVPPKLKLNVNPKVYTESDPNLPIKVFEGFAGYGGASFALNKLNYPHVVVGYSEINESAVKIYDQNHVGIKNYGDISKIDETKLPDFDLFTGGFPCQPFSTAGLGLGESDLRGTLFNDIIRIVSHKKPEMILLENVKGLLSKRHKQTFEKILSELSRLGYKTYYKLLNTLDYGIPQNRERLWIFATLNKKFDENFNLEIPLIRPIPRIQEFLDQTPGQYLYLSSLQVDHLIAKHKVNLDVSEKLCLDIYNKKVKQDGICCTLTEPHHNTIRIVEPKRGDPALFQVRKLSPEEHFRLMGFTDGEIDFAGLSYTNLCQRAGNGWDINVVSKILDKILSIARSKR